MTREEFLAALDRHGGDLQSWPPSFRREAQTLAVQDAVAAAALDRQKQLDALIARSLTPEPVDAALIGRIVARRSQAIEGGPIQPTRRAIGWVSVALAATLIVGFVAGALVPPDDGGDLYAALIFGGSDIDAGGEPL